MEWYVVIKKRAPIPNDSAVSINIASYWSGNERLNHIKVKDQVRVYWYKLGAITFDSESSFP